MSKWLELEVKPECYYYTDSASVSLSLSAHICWNNFEYSDEPLTVEVMYDDGKQYTIEFPTFNEGRIKEGQEIAPWGRSISYKLTGDERTLPERTFKARFSGDTDWVSATYPGGYFNRDFFFTFDSLDTPYFLEDLAFKIKDESSLEVSDLKWEILDYKNNILLTGTTFDEKIKITKQQHDELFMPTCIFEYDVYKKIRFYFWGILKVSATYNGKTVLYSTTISSYTQGKTPTLEYSIYDSNPITIALTGDNQKFIRYFSTLNITANWTCYAGATLASSSIYYNAGGVIRNVSEIRNVANIKDTKTTFIGTDSRGLSTTITATPTLIPYTKLTCSFNPSITMEGKVSFTVAGNYFNSSLGTSNNTLTVKYRYKKKGSATWGDWTAITPMVSGSQYSSSVSLTLPDFQYKDVYIFQAQSDDLLMSVSTPEYVANASPVFDWSDSDFNFNVPVSIMNKPVYTETVLFNGSTNAQVSLSDSVENYKYLEIFFTDNIGKGEGYAKVYSPNGKTAHLDLVETIGGAFYIRHTNYEISEYSIAPTVYAYAYYSGSSWTYSSKMNYLYITRVVGLS